MSQSPLFPMPEPMSVAEPEPVKPEHARVLRPTATSCVGSQRPGRGTAGGGTDRTPHGSRPKAYLVDGGYAAREDITSLEQTGVSVYAPVRLPRNRPEQERYEPHYGDTAEVTAWRQRMATEEGQEV